MTAMQPLVAVAVLGLLVHLGMGVRTAVALRRVGVPATRAWTASLLAWPLVRRAVARHDPGGPAGEQGDRTDAGGHPDDGDRTARS
jgi:hypothetical protein